MTTISRNNALCIFYSEEMNDETAKRLALKLESAFEYDLCYSDDPRKPMLQTKVMINGNPFYYHRYTNDCTRPSTSVDKVMLRNYSQVIAYMNQAYQPSAPTDQELFEIKPMSMKEMYAEMILITDLFDDNSVKSFSTWCGIKKLAFLRVEQQRKYQNNEQKTRRRLLWALKKVHRESIAKKILNVGKEHKEKIESLKKDGLQVIGYVRKFPGNEDAKTRFRLLDSMVNRLEISSAVDMVFGSYSSKAKEPFSKRDIANPTHVPRTFGNTQDLLKLLSTTSKPVAIVAIDFAGLTTNTSDLIQWLRDFEIVKTVLIDNIDSLNQTYTFTRDQLLTDTSLLQQFDSRPAPINRSSKS